MFHEENGFAFEASADLRELIRNAGGLRVDWRTTVFGGGFVVRLDNAGSCGCG